MIILTSFRYSLKILKHDAFINADCFSVSRFQPAGFSYPSLPFLAAIGTDGKKISLTECGGSTIRYREKLYDYWSTQWDDIQDWKQCLDNRDITLLCCWCPHAAHSRRQLKEHKTFVCHTGIIGQSINKARPDIDLYMDIEHHERLVDEYKPENYKVLVL